MTHQTRAELDEEAHCLVKNTVGLQEAGNGALLCSMEIANKPRRNEAHRCPASSEIAQTPRKGAKTPKIAEVLSILKSGKIQKPF